MVVLIGGISNRKCAFPFKSIVYFVEWFFASPICTGINFPTKICVFSFNLWVKSRCMVEDKSAKGRLFKIKLSIRKFEKWCKNLLIILLWFRGNAIYDFFLLFLGHRLFPLLFSKKKSKMTNRLSHSILFGIAIPSGPLSLLWTHANEVFRMFEPPFFVVIFLFVLLK